MKQLIKLIPFIGILLIQLINGENVRDLVNSTKVTDFGVFGEFEDCPDDTLVIGFQLKVETRRPSRFDNTALNGITFFCGNPGTKESVLNATSSEGRFGSYRDAQYCPTYAVGFRLKSQSYQGAFTDDVAAVNLKLICADGTEIEGYDEDDNVYPDAKYSEPLRCKEGKAICGLQTQVEGYQFFRKDHSFYKKSYYLIH